LKHTSQVCNNLLVFLTIFLLELRPVVYVQYKDKNPDAVHA